MVAQRREIVVFHRGIIEQADQERGNHFQMRYPVLLDQRAHIVRLGARAEHHPPALKQKTLNAGTRERQIVRDGQHDQKNRIPGNPANVAAILEL